MKIIEAMKRLKMNEEKVADLRKRIASVSANLTIETPLYGDETKAKIREWLQACADISQDDATTLVRIQRTNLATEVTIEIGGKLVTKTIAEWVWRRRKFAKADLDTWAQLTDRGLKEQTIMQSTGEKLEIKLVRQYDPNERDERLSVYRAEPHLIDGALEIVNATTDLLE